MSVAVVSLDPDLAEKVCAVVRSKFAAEIVPAGQFPPYTFIKYHIIVIVACTHPDCSLTEEFLHQDIFNIVKDANSLGDPQMQMIVSANEDVMTRLEQTYSMYYNRSALACFMFALDITARKFSDLVQKARHLGYLAAFGRAPPCETMVKKIKHPLKGLSGINYIICRYLIMQHYGESMLICMMQCPLPEVRICKLYKMVSYGKVTALKELLLSSRKTNTESAENVLAIAARCVEQCLDDILMVICGTRGVQHFPTCGYDEIISIFPNEYIQNYLGLRTYPRSTLRGLLYTDEEIGKIIAAVGVRPETLDAELAETQNIGKNTLEIIVTLL